MRHSRFSELPWDIKLDQFIERAVVGLVPIVSSAQAEKRIQLAKDFSNLLIGDVDDQTFINEMENIFEEAEQQGWFSETNEFFLQEMIDLMPGGGFGDEAVTQRVWAALDTLLFATPAQVGGLGKAVVAGAKATPSLVVGGAKVGFNLATDVGRLLAISRKDPALYKEVISDAVKIDDPDGVVNVARISNDSAATPDADFGEFVAYKTEARKFEQESTVFLRLQELDFPLPFDEEEFSVFRSDVVSTVQANAAENGTTRSLDFDVIHDKFGNVFAQEIMGTTKGNTFKGNIGKVSAQRLADSIGGEVRPALGQPNEWVVLKSDNVATLPNKPTSVEDITLWKSTDTGELGNTLWSRFGSPLAQTTPELNGLMKRVESFQSNLSRSLKREQKAILKGMKKANVREVQDVFDSMLNGDLASLNFAPDVQDFSTEFYKIHRTNPSEAQTALYLKYQEIVDVEYLVTSNRMFQQAVNRGEVGVLRNDDSVIRAIPGTKEHAPSDGHVLDLNTETFVDVDTLPDGTVFYRSAEGAVEGPGGANASVFVMSSPKTRRLYPTDLLEYNPGGHRIYRDGEVNFYIKQDNALKVHDGTELNATPTTIMGVRTEKEAAKAVKQINDIVDTIKTQFPRINKATFEGILRGASNNGAILSAIGRSNEWNVNINTIDELVNWAVDSGVDLSKGVTSVGDGEPILEAGKLFPALDPLSTAGETMRVNSARSGKRRNTVLMGYGGTANRTRPAMESIEKGYMASAINQSESAYIAKATAGLMKAASEKGLLKNSAEMANLTMRQRLEKMELLTSSEAGKKLELERQKIVWRMAKENPATNAWKAGMSKLSESLYDKGFKWGADTVNVMSKDPVSALRGFVFDSQLGFFAIDQLIVQSSQITSVAGIAGVPGIKGVASYPLTRFALNNGNPAVVRRVGELLEPILDITPDQYVEMIGMFKSSGRNVIDMSTAEAGGANTTGVFKGVREAGRVFFNEGELTARIAAHNASYLEYLAKFGPDAKPTSASGKNWIANRQDVLTQGMTNASRTPYDWVPGAQFMSYTMRMAEAVFAGTLTKGKSVLTRAEKGRLAAAHVFVYGASGIPTASFVLDRIERVYGFRPSESAYQAVRGGALDATLSHLSGVDTALSSRVAWGEGFFKLAYDTPEKTWIEMLGGPSADVVYNSVGSAVNLAKHMAVGGPGLVKQDLVRFQRAFKTGNLLHNSFLAYTTGAYLTRKGVLVSDDNSAMEAWLLGWGIPLEKHVSAYAGLSAIIKDKETVKRLAKSIEEQVNVYTHLIRQEEYDEATVYMEQIGLAMQSFPVWQRQEVWRKIFPSISPLVEKIALEKLENSIKRGIN
jgi:hypothetical protein